MPLSDPAAEKKINELAQRLAEARETITTIWNDTQPHGRRLAWLEKNHQKLEQLCSTLAADLARVDNKTEPAKGTTAQRLDALELLLGEDSRGRTELYSRQQQTLDELAALRSVNRDLIAALAEWLPEGTTARDRLKHLIDLTPNDLHTGPSVPA